MAYGKIGTLDHFVSVRPIELYRGFPEYAYTDRELVYG